jgi:hypothetical protein
MFRFLKVYAKICEHFVEIGRHLLEKRGDTFVRFQVLTAANMKMTVFWDVVPCGMVEHD